MIDYYGLEKQLEKRGITKSELGNELGISSRTIAKIAKNEKIAARVMERIAAYMGCSTYDLSRECSRNALLQALRDEKSAGISGGIYHELQVRMTYNSNHIEGSALTEAQTRMIFETNTIDCGDGLSVDDILETVHHFRAIDYCIDIAEAPLTEDIIKKLHYIIKQDTQDANLRWFAVGAYKRRPNYVGGHETTQPDEVNQAISELLNRYNNLEIVTINDIIKFHAEFELIHPFQDGNGRVGRLIAFKECLRNDIVPFIIEDSKKSYYYRGLQQWSSEQGYLIDTCLDGQDTVNSLIISLNI